MKKTHNERMPLVGPVSDHHLIGVKLRPDMRDSLLEERQTTHGSFADNAIISQNIKAAMALNRERRAAVFNEALDMIALKISRICSGHETFRDHWDDIAGYAKLAAEVCD